MGKDHHEQLPGEHPDEHGRQVNHRHIHSHHSVQTNHHQLSSPSLSHSKQILPASHQNHEKVFNSNDSHNHSNTGQRNRDNHLHNHTLSHSHSDVAHGEKHHSHSHNSMSTINGLWMLVDGIGLALITAATVLEGYELWIHFFNQYWETNTTSLTLWFLGRTCQIIGLMFLIGHASSFQVFHEIEQFGMLMLTIGPIVNMIACYSFFLSSDPEHLFQKQWFSTEAMELTGILILDISMMDMEEIRVLTAELIGFLCLCAAAGVTMEFEPILHPSPSVPASYASIAKNKNSANNNRYTTDHRLLPLNNNKELSDILHSLDIQTVLIDAPHQKNNIVNSHLEYSWSEWIAWFIPSNITWRLDTIHMSEICGLLMLMLVAYGQYRMKLQKHQLQIDHHNSSHSHHHQVDTKIVVDKNGKDHELSHVTVV